VTVLPKTGTLGFGVDDSSDWYAVVVGNVVVSYGGGDADTLDRVKRAVGALQPWSGRYSPLASPSE
jgi:hypothetical protein